MTRERSLNMTHSWNMIVQTLAWRNRRLVIAGQLAQRSDLLMCLAVDCTRILSVLVENCSFAATVGRHGDLVC